jgi:predicted Rossmann fold nucleotide-binding protein DprA/Smf involved in DNA uptake
VRFAPKQRIKQGAKLATGAGDAIEELPTPMRAALLQAEKPDAEQRDLLAAVARNGSENKLHERQSAQDQMHINDIAESAGLNSSKDLATLFELEKKGIIRELPGK